MDFVREREISLDLLKVRKQSAIFKKQQQEDQSDIDYQLDTLNEFVVDMIRKVNIFQDEQKQEQKELQNYCVLDKENIHSIEIQRVKEQLERYKMYSQELEQKMDQMRDQYDKPFYTQEDESEQLNAQDIASQIQDNSGINKNQNKKDYHEKYRKSEKYNQELKKQIRLQQDQINNLKLQNERQKVCYEEEILQLKHVITNGEQYIKNAEKNIQKWKFDHSTQLCTVIAKYKDELSKQKEKLEEQKKHNHIYKMILKKNKIINEENENSLNISDFSEILASPSNRQDSQGNINISSNENNTNNNNSNNNNMKKNVDYRQRVQELYKNMLHQTIISNKKEKSSQQQQSTTQSRLKNDSAKSGISNKIF